MNNGPELRATREQITDAAVREAGGFLVAPGTVLLSFKLSIGKVGIAAVPMFTNEAIAALPIRTPERLDATYLTHALRALDLSAGANRAAMGNTLNKAALAKLRIPLPPLAKQRRIARILDAAAALRARRIHALSLVESMISAEFVSRFGSPVTNPRGWRVQRLGEVGLLDRGVSRHRPRNAPKLLGGPYPLIQTGDVARSGGLVTRHSATYSEEGLRQSKLWPPGTLCITIAANIAMTGILTFAACFPDSVVGFSADRATVVYVQAWLKFLQPVLERSAPQSAQRNINLQILRALPVPVPPNQELIAFADAVAAIRKIHARMTAQLDSMAVMRSSLAGRAFGGEL